MQSKMTANLRHYLHSPILNIIKISDKYRIFKLNAMKIPVDILLLTKNVLNYTVNNLIMVSTILA